MQPNRVIPADANAIANQRRELVAGRAHENPDGGCLLVRHRLRVLRRRFAVLAVVGMVLAIVISPRSAVSTAGDLVGQAPAILVAALYALLVVRVTYGYFRQDGAQTNTAHEG